MGLLAPCFQAQASLRCGIGPKGNLGFTSSTHDPIMPALHCGVC